MQLRTFLVISVLPFLFASPALCQNAAHVAQRGHGHTRHKAVKMVAYDAKDKRWYSVAWAKAHHMRDRGGDKLIIIPASKLPKDAKMSRAMQKGK